MLFIVVTLQMSEVAVTVVVWAIGSQTVQNWRRSRISKPPTLDGVTILPAMQQITNNIVT